MSEPVSADVPMAEAPAKTAGGEVLYTSTLDASEGEVLGKIYKFSDDMAAAKEYEQYADDFKSLIDAASSSARAKNLVAMLIPKYAAHFPAHAADALAALTTLTEDEDSKVRVIAIKGLPHVCKGSDGKALADAVIKASGLLVRMTLKAGDDKEREAAVSSATEALVKLDVRSVSECLLGYMEAPEGEEHDALREVACNFLQHKVWSKAAELVRPFEDIEEFLKGRIEKVLEVASEAEFKLLIDILKGLKIFETGQKYGPQGLADIIAEQALLLDTIEPESVDELSRVLECVNIALPFLKRGATDTKMSINIIEKIMPVFDKFTPINQAVILQRLCQLAFFLQPSAVPQCIGPVFALLLAQLPEPKATPEPAAAEGESGEAAEAETPKPDIPFTYVEALLFLVHQYGHKDPAALAKISGIPLEGAGDTNAETYKTFKDKLMETFELSEFVLRKLQAVVPKAKSTKTPEDIERKKTLERAMAAIKNITDMSRPLITLKPSCLQQMPSGKFSWNAAVHSNPLKRAAPASTSANPAKKATPATYVPLSRRGGQQPTHKKAA